MGNYDYKKAANFLHSIDPVEFALLGLLIGLVIGENLDSNEKNTLGNFFEQIGQTLITVATQEFLLNDDNPNNKESNNYDDRINELERQINELKKSRFNGT